MKKDLRGFTLVELSMVLIIVGLLVGGVLLGRDLIYAAQIRKVIKQVDQYNLAESAFQLKYNCMPGDCANASAFGFGATDGNGDGIIGCVDPSDMRNCVNSLMYILTPTNGEYINFWYHLRLAGLIPDVTLPYDSAGSGGLQGAGVYSPKLPLKPIGTASSSSLKGGIAIRGIVKGGPLGFDRIQGHNFIFGEWALVSKYEYLNYWPKDTYAVDSKMDDGFPESGIVRAASSILSSGASPYNQAYVVSSGSPTSRTDICVNTDTTPHSYNMFTTDAASFCGPIIKAAF